MGKGTKKCDHCGTVRMLSSLYRGKFLDGLKREYEAGELKFRGQIDELKEAPAFKRLITNLYHQACVVYCRPPLKNPEKVIGYLGRYTHRVGQTGRQPGHLSREGFGGPP